MNIFLFCFYDDKSHSAGDTGTYLKRIREIIFYKNDFII
jgi:hypothetical protein